MRGVGYADVFGVIAFVFILLIFLRVFGVI